MKKTWITYALGFLSGMSLAFGQAPFSFLIFAALGCIGIIFLFTQGVEGNSHAQRSFVLGWVIYSGIVCWWIGFFGVFAFAAFLLAQALLSGGFLWLSRRFLANHTNPIFIAISWVFFEWVVAHIPVISFPWLTLSTLSIDTFLVRFARVGGGALVTFVTVAIAAGVVRVLQDRSFSRKEYIVSGISAVVLLMIFISSFVALENSDARISVASLQGNNLNRDLTTEEYRDDYLKQTHLALATQITEDHDLIVFPESAFRTDPLEDDELFNELTKVARRTDLLLVNSVAYEDGKKYNRNYFFDSSMALQDYYDKIRLVPFGEYVPGERFIGSWPIFDAIGQSYSPGSRYVTVDHVSSVICYESAFTDDVKMALNDDAKILVVTTNNRSYRRSGNSAQHLNLSRMRAAEFGISVVHASVSGQSAFIERDGSVIAQSELFTKSVLSGQMSFGYPDSIYAKTGDWLSLLSLFVVGYLCLINRRNFSWKNRMSKK